MLGRLAELARLYHWHWRTDRSYRRWLVQHPGGDFGQYYAHDARERIAQANAKGRRKPPRTLGNDLDPISARVRAESLLEYLKWMGCRPDHLVVDFGCGSLWVGEVLMRYLDPGRYLGMDVVDFFYTEAQARVGPAVIRERQPAFEVISPDSLARGRTRNPDYILSTAVLQHVRPREMSDYFSRIVSLCTPSTRVIIGHKPGKRTIVSASRSLQHGRGAIRKALDRLGYEPRFARPEEAPACQVALFEIVPRTGTHGSRR
jgi:hypothetical protein